MKHSGLLFADLRGLDICIGYCPNKHLHIFGGAQQLKGAVDTVTMTMTTVVECAECGCEIRRVDKLKWDTSLMSEGAGI